MLGEDRLQYDPAGNMTYDGQFKYTYDAWNRLVKVQRAYPDSDADGNCEVTSTVAIIAYDGLGRRISKAVTNSGDWGGAGQEGCTYHYFWDDWQMIELRDGSDELLKQYVWGLEYIDELVQIGMATEEDICVYYFWACQDANYNLLGLMALLCLQYCVEIWPFLSPGSV